MRHAIPLSVTLMLCAAPSGAVLAVPPGGLPQMFVPSGQCSACHDGLTSPSGRDVSFGADWRSSMMANSARDPYWQAAVRREIMDHPSAQAAIEDECGTCHMPMAHKAAQAAGGKGSVFAHLPVGAKATRTAALAADGVSCSVCHQIRDDNLGEEESFTGGFVVDATTARWGQREVYGPYEVDRGRTRLMHSATGFTPAKGEHLQGSELCATCHTLYTHALGPDGEVVGELPEQVPYLEWLHSGYPGEESCQSCHMPPLDEPTAISSVMPKDREGVSPHVFRGGNFFVLAMLNRFRAELGVAALPAELSGSAEATVRHLRESSARLGLEAAAVRDGWLAFDVAIRNLAGHKLPTAYPSRRAWLHVVVRDGAGGVLFESGRFMPSGAIEGNDNDEDPGTFEPHHARIEDPSQVQVYEGILAGPDGAVTTGLLTATHYVKDNRLLPRGFDKDAAGEDIAVRGAAADDPDFRGGGDRTRYAVDVRGASGPYRVEAALWYQPISFRWADNQAPYDAFETNRFQRYYEAMSDSSAVVLVQTATTIQ
ncbi:MAG: hypothetical protein ACQEXJ_19415 [Myxococcota bacterium]